MKFKDFEIGRLYRFHSPVNKNKSIGNIPLLLVGKIKSWQKQNMLVFLDKSSKKQYIECETWFGQTLIEAVE